MQRRVRCRLRPPPRIHVFEYVSGNWQKGPELAGIAHLNLVSGRVSGGDRPVFAALSLLGKFRFPAAFHYFGLFC